MMKLWKWIGAALTIGLASFVHAQDWPNKPIQVIVPFPPGSVDAKARIVTDRVSKILGQPLVILNKPGAGMRIGTEQLLRSPADGYTLEVVVQAVAWMGPLLDPAVTYQPLTDMTMLALAYENPMILVANQDSGIKSVDDLLQTARTHPGKLNWAGPAGASGYRVWFEVFKGMTGLDVTYVPYRGLTPALTNVAGGFAQVAFADYSSMPLILDGKLRPLAVTGPARSAQLPNVPTLKELGIGFEATQWLGFVAPAGLPQAVESRLVKAFAMALKDPQTRAAIESDGAQVILDSSPSAMRGRITSEMAQFRKNVKPGAIKID
ncbi:MAG: tripartite tricarboxylate transporter substrate binding protein [Simplicispira suum]|uniref:Bug family tripartite tricarboxylate transporter substrate binding protein n=1 Tax=Simplicispira suum TaxID=2109915 RepID=UPI001C6B620D|nr:tripartite tricarboxylate transporter substrate binding protein [Simplicispira suum]MBW7833461.1 tripartite tricarboxylate transporter substrate binding protein [Simplicispira suum]